MDIPEIPMPTSAVIICGLAQLSTVEYERSRETEAQRLGMRISVLDAEVKKARAASISDNHRSPEYTDDALALTFSERHAHDLRYVAAWGKWSQWTGRVWRADDVLQVYDRARRVCREASAECPDDGAAVGLAKAQTVAAVERLARSDPRHASTVQQWDTDPWLLNTPGGVVDLQSGKLFPHRSDYHMTKICAVAPGGECPQWHKFLAKITNDNLELRDFLQRVAGYCLTGITREHALFFGYGTGGNGKGVFLNTLTAIMGDYATVASIDTFTASSNERHPTDLAMLRGARLVSAQETEEGRRWAESRIKAMTGGDPITARFMRQDFFTYQPQFKLFIAGNHKPGLRNVDEAIRRRFNLVPFDVKIPAAERDHELPEKLRAEWPGILKWMIEGCLIWQRDGLNPPVAVTSATDEYFEAEDAFGLWLAECCIIGKTYESTSANLFASWSAWAGRAGEVIGSQKRFSQNLLARGFQPKRYGGGKTGFIGLNATVAVGPHFSEDNR